MNQTTYFIASWIASTVAAYVLGSFAQSVFIIRELSAIGAEFTISIITDVILHDLANMAFGGKYVSYGANLLMAFLVAMPCAVLTARFIKIPLALVAPVAGVVAVLTMIGIVNLNADSALFAGTRGWNGMLAQVVAGAVGGSVFAVMYARRNSTVFDDSTAQP